MAFSLRPLLFKLHLYVAVAISLYVAILGITGAIMAFEPEIDHLAHANLAYVTPAPARLSLAALGEAVDKAYPGQKISGYTIGAAPDLSTMVWVDPTLVYVNPYTGQILGSRTDGRTILGFIHSLHQRLTAPRPGHDKLTRTFVSWITVAALFLVVSGVWLWWPRMRFGIGTGGGLPFWYDVHTTLGITAAAFLVLLTVTGINLGFEGSTMLIYTLTGSTGSQAAPPLQIPPPPTDAAQPFTIDRALAIAGDALPGATPAAIFGPTPRGVYIVTARMPGDHSSNGRSRVTIDQYSGAVVAANNLNTASAGARLVALNRAIHTGDIFGIPSKAVMALASLIIALQALSGGVLWIKRTPFRSMIPGLAAAAAVTAIAICTVLAGI
jgi:uncharacterized iron-regulated membrane protein